MTANYIDTIDNFMHDTDFVMWLRLTKPPTLKVAWDSCPRGDEMLDLVYACIKYGDLHVDRRTFAACACDIAELALPRVPAGEHRPRFAIATARLLIRGQATAGEVSDAGGRASRAASDARMVGRDSASACLAAAAAAYSAAVERSAEACAWASRAAVNAGGTRTRDCRVSDSPVIINDWTSDLSADIARVVRKYLPDPPDISVLEAVLATGGVK